MKGIIGIISGCISISVWFIILMMSARLVGMH